MMLTTMIKIPWLHYRAGGILDFTPMLGGHKKTLIVVANLGWQKGQSLSPLE